MPYEKYYYPNHKKSGNLLLSDLKDVLRNQNLDQYLFSINKFLSKVMTVYTT